MMWRRSLMDQWEAVKHWRQRRDAIIMKRQRPTYDPYPDHVDEPEVKVYVEARDVRGRLLREYVYLEGYSLHQVNVRRGAKRGNQLVGEWVWDALIEANVRLAARLADVRAQKEATDVPK